MIAPAQAPPRVAAVRSILRTVMCLSLNRSQKYSLDRRIAAGNVSRHNEGEVAEGIYPTGFAFSECGEVVSTSCDISTALGFETSDRKSVV